MNIAWKGYLNLLYYHLELLQSYDVMYLFLKLLIHDNIDFDSLEEQVVQMIQTILQQLLSNVQIKEMIQQFLSELSNEQRHEMRTRFLIQL